MHEERNNKQAFCWGKDPILDTHTTHQIHWALWFFFKNQTLKDGDIGFDGVELLKNAILGISFVICLHTVF